MRARSELRWRTGAPKNSGWYFIIVDQSSDYSGDYEVVESRYYTDKHEWRMAGSEAVAYICPVLAWAEKPSISPKIAASIRAKLGLRECVPA